MSVTYAAQRTTGRRYRITDGALTELSIPYQVLTPRLPCAPGIESLTGFPAVNSNPSSSDLEGLPSAQVGALYLQDVDVTEDDSGIKWIFTATYKIPTVSGAAAGGGEGEDPTQYQSRITHGTKIVEVDMCGRDFAGQIMLNSAGRPYPSGIPLKFPARIISVEKYLKQKISVYGVSGTCNAATVTIDGEEFAAGTAIIDATCETSGDKKFPWKLRFTVEDFVTYLDKTGKNTGCRVQMLNAGYEFYKWTDESQKVLCRFEVERENGSSITAATPAMLDSDGALLEDGEEPTYKTYQIAREVNWPAWVSA